MDKTDSEDSILAKVGKNLLLILADAFPLINAYVVMTSSHSFWYGVFSAVGLYLLNVAYLAKVIIDAGIVGNASKMEELYKEKLAEHLVIIQLIVFILLKLV